MVGPSRAVGIGGAMLALVVCAAPAHGEQAQCQRTIAKESAKFVQVRTKALQKCQGARVRSGSGTCPDAKAIGAIEKAAAKLAAGIGLACGGDDSACGGAAGNEDTPAAVGWPALCRNFERGTCENAISDCGGIATCLRCIGEAAVDQALGIVYGSLNLPSAGAVTRCQQAIGKATAAFLAAKSKALRRCWDARIAGKHPDPCIAPARADGRYLAAIQKAEAKKIATICKACGGSDGGCDAALDTGKIVFGGGIVAGTAGSDDLTVAQVGFGATCPNLTLPYPPSTDCGTLDDQDGAPNVIDSLRELILCADCVSAFTVDCVDANQVPAFAAYPAACHACTTGLPTGACPTALQITPNGIDADLDLGWEGTAHDQILPPNGRLTLEVSGCAQASFPCGACSLSGPIANAGGPAFDNRRCTNNTSRQCVDDTPCGPQCLGGINDGGPCTADSECPGAACAGAGTCEFFFSAPLSLSVGGANVCLTNQIVGPVTGTIDLDTGATQASLSLLWEAYDSLGALRPCPVCAGGVCASGARAGKTCTVNGSNVFGAVSFDCPPERSMGGQVNTLQISTGTETRVLTPASPNCTQTGAITKKCFCDTCNNASAEACSSNADCPPSGGNAGICGGKRCVGGTNDGTPCAESSECPPAGGATCAVKGQKTAPNQCDQPGGCQPTADNEGECVDGPFDPYCSVDYFHGCSTAADCNPPLCPDCVAGQTCLGRPRECYPDNGVIGGSVSVTGVADPPCAGTFSQPTLGSLFCQALPFPALGRLKLPAKVVLTP